MREPLLQLFPAVNKLKIVYHLQMSFAVTKRQQMVGQAAILAAAFFYSTSGLLIKLLDMHPIVITGLRSSVAALFLLIVRFISPPPKGRKNPPIPFWIGALVYAFTLFTFVTANKLTTAANVILLQYSAPIWAALLGWALIKEKPNLEHWIALIFIMGGLLLFFRDGLGSGVLEGNVLSIISGILLGAHYVFLRMLKDGDPRDAMLAAHALTAVLSIPFIFLYPPSLKVSTVLPLLYMGFIQMGLASLLLSYGIRHTTAIQAMLIAIIDPMLNPVWVLIVTGERPTLSALAGGVIIIAAVVASSLIGMRRTTEGRHNARAAAGGE